MTASPDSPRALIRYTLVGLALTVFVAWALWEVRDALMLLYISALVAIGLSPVVNAIERKRLMRQRVPRWAAILVIYVGIIGVIVTVAMLIIPPLVTQARDLAMELPRLLHQGQQWLITHGLLSHEITAQEAVQQTTGSRAQDTAGLVIGAVGGFVGGIFGFITMLVLAFYLLNDSSGLVTVFVRLFPREKRAQVQDACRRVTNKVSAWLAGQLLLGGIIGGTAALGLFLMGVPFFYVLALIAGLGEMIPIVGPILSAVPAIAVALSVKPTLALGVIAFFFAQQQLENHLLVPNIMQRQVGISPVVVISALLIGGSLLGVIGAILAVPTAAILQVVFEELMNDTSEE
ncbi:MAG TPA: AI-2E family transporter [Vicinamibacterales bacterium]|nr:AI-2E family transporter [Vicinamibacterales bacterium]